MINHTGSSRSGVTIRDVAHAAGVSVTTVSNLLNGRESRMRPGTKKRVLRTIDDLGYSPNHAARQLRTGHATMIGLLVPSVANPFWGAFAHAVESEAAQVGHQVLLGNAERDPARERLYLDELWARGVRSVIVASSLPDLHHLDEAIARGMLIVAVDREQQPADPPGLISVSVDNELGGRLATEHLIGLGHRRIGFLSGKIATVSRQSRLAGYRDALRDAGIRYRRALVWSGDDDDYGDVRAAEAGALGAEQLLASPTPPTALVAINDMYALGACLAIRRHSLDVPGISVVGFDDTVIAELANPPLTTVRQPLPEMARFVVQTVSARPGNPGPDSSSMAPELIVRESTAPPPSTERQR